MKKALFTAPMFAAVLFTIAGSWKLINQADGDYIPVVFEILLFLFGYLAALAANTLVVIPLCLAVRLKTSNLAAGFLLALVLALLGTTAAYAWEIFGYQPSILHADYFYPLFMPIAITSLASFYFVTRRPSRHPVPDGDEEEEEGGAAGDTG